MTLRSKSPTYSRCSRGLLSIGSRSDAGSYKRLPTQDHGVSSMQVECYRPRDRDGGAAASDPQQPLHERPMAATSCVDSCMHDERGNGVEAEDPDRQDHVCGLFGLPSRLTPEILETLPVQCFTISMILANTIIIGFETDMPHLCHWDMVENGFLVGFTAELVFRLYVIGARGYFAVRNNPDFFWNIFDLLIVTTGIINFLVTALMGDQHGLGKDAALFRIVRLLRVLRVLRIIRIVRFLKQLYLLAYGFLEGAMAVFWVTLLASFMLYICSVVLVRTYGRLEEQEGVDDQDVEFFGDHFGSIPRTMFSLFELISAPDLRPYRAIMFKNPPLVLFLVTFIILGSFGINGLLVALINESILEKNQARLEADRMDRESKRKVMQARCRELFDSLDKNNNRVLPRNELKECTAQLAAIFESLGVPFQHKDLDQMFYIMDYNDTGIIERSEFVQGVLELCDQIRPMSIMELHYQVSKCVNKVEAADSKVDAVVKAAEQHDLRLDRMQIAIDRQRRFPLHSLSGLDSPTSRTPGSPSANAASPCTPARRWSGDSPASPSAGAAHFTVPVAATTTSGQLHEQLLEHERRLREATARIAAITREPELEASPGAVQALSESLLNLQQANCEVLGALLSRGWSRGTPAEKAADGGQHRGLKRASTMAFDPAGGSTTFGREGTAASGGGSAENLGALAGSQATQRSEGGSSLFTAADRRHSDPVLTAPGGSASGAGAAAAGAGAGSGQSGAGAAAADAGTADSPAQQRGELPQLALAG